MVWVVDCVCVSSVTTPPLSFELRRGVFRSGQVRVGSIVRPGPGRVLGIIICQGSGFLNKFVWFPGQFVVSSPFNQEFKLTSMSVVPEIFNSIDEPFLFTVYFYGWWRFISLSGQGRFRFSSRSEQVRIENVIDLHRVR